MLGIREPERPIIIARRPPIKFRVPTIDDEATLVEISDRGLPLVTLVQVSAFDDAATGKTQKPGLHVFQELHEIGAQAVRAVLPGVRRIERYEIYIDRAVTLQQQIEVRFTAFMWWPQ